MRRHVSLPVLAPRVVDGTAEPQFVRIREREAELAAEFESWTAEQLIADVRREGLLSGNAKTSVSLDFPIGHTCTPTRLCASVCYASRGGAPAAWDKSLRKRLRNLAYFRRVPTMTAVYRLRREVATARRRYAARGVVLDFLRVNGTGDLFPELVWALNWLTQHEPALTLWVVTRKLAMAELLEPRPNLYLQISTDATTPAAELARSAELIARNPRAYRSFLRTQPDEPTHAAAIVFNEKRTAGLEYSGITDCPVDAGRLDLGNIRGKGGDACAQCRKCFSPKTLERQRAALGQEFLHRAFGIGAPEAAP